MVEFGREDSFQPYLLSGERILWNGSPDPGRLLTRADIFLIPFSLLWGGFAIFWEAAVVLAGASHGGPPLFFVLWGIPFVVVGQYFIWGRFLYKRWDRRRTLYAVTNQRILVLRGKTNLQSMFLAQLPTLSQTARPDGSGTLEFSNPPFPYGFWGNTGLDWFNRRDLLAFYDIPDVARVYRLIATARSTSS